MLLEHRKTQNEGAEEKQELLEDFTKPLTTHRNLVDIKIEKPSLKLENPLLHRSLVDIKTETIAQVRR